MASVGKTETKSGVSLLDAMADAGLSPEKVIADGAIHRLRDQDERPGQKAGWYIAFPGENGKSPIAACVFGSWRRGTRSRWSHGSTEDDPKLQEKLLLAIKIANAEREREYQRVATRQQNIYKNASAATIDHPYIVAKGLGSAPWAKKSNSETLILPMMDVRNDQLVNIQRIARDGTKKFGKRGRFLGTYLRIGPAPIVNQPLYLAEGYATACSIHEATNSPCLVAWATANMEHVAHAARQRYPASRLIIAADNDQWTKEPIDNPGVTVATRVAATVGCTFVVPSFKRTNTLPTDFNDLFRLEGAKEVAKQLRGKGKQPENLILYRGDPMGNARRFLLDKYTIDNRPTLHWWRGDWYGWSGTHYPALEDDAMRSAVYHYLERAERIDNSGQPVPFQPKKDDVTALLDALKAVVHLSRDNGEPPVWLDNRSSPRPREMMSLLNGILHMPSKKIGKHTPELFINHTLPFSYNPDAPQPRRWLAFLDTLWKENLDNSIYRQVDGLQEMFGYILSGDMRQQKIFMLVGPTRSGKSTIAKILRDLVGPSNTGALSLTSLSTNFGLQTLIGKPLAIIGDARIGPKADSAVVVDRLLTISGEDPIPIDRKNKDIWEGVLPTRLVILTNELPSLRDVSGALATRLVIIRLTESFVGRENTSLYESFATELPGIFNWALAGWDCLRQRGHIVTPTRSVDMMQGMREVSSPVAHFIRDSCIIDPSAEIGTAVLYQRWRHWCEAHGIDYIAPEGVFGRDLRAVLPQIERKQKRAKSVKGVAGDVYYAYVGIGAGR